MNVLLHIGKNLWVSVSQIFENVLQIVLLIPWINLKVSGSLRPLLHQIINQPVLYGNLVYTEKGNITFSMLFEKKTSVISKGNVTNMIF
jgi:hypothetical protein